MKKMHIFLWGLVIVLIIILLFAGGIFLTKKYNLTNKFGISGNVVDYGVYEDEKALIGEFSKIYSENLKKGEKTYLVLGNKDEINIVSYEEISQGKIGLIMENKNQNINIAENKYSLTKIIPQNNKVEILINGKNYEFELKQNENVYFIIKD